MGKVDRERQLSGSLRALLCVSHDMTDLLVPLIALLGRNQMSRIHAIRLSVARIGVDLSVAFVALEVRNRSSPAEPGDLDALPSRRLGREPRFELAFVSRPNARSYSSLLLAARQLLPPLTLATCCDR
jgi:hypothetical protein